MTTPAEDQVQAFVKWATSVRNQHEDTPITFRLTVRPSPGTTERSLAVCRASEYKSGEELALKFANAIDAYNRAQGASYGSEYQSFFVRILGMGDVVYADEAIYTTSSTFYWTLPPLTEDWRAEHFSSAEVWALRETLAHVIARLADALEPAWHEKYSHSIVGYLIDKCAKNSVPAARVARLLDILDLDDEWTVERLKTYREAR